MKKTLLTLAVLYAAGALITPYFAGQYLQKDIEHFFHSSSQKNLAAQGIDITLDNYQKGYFSSIANLHLRWYDQSSGDVFYDSALQAKITHAPFSLSGINAATIDITGRNKPQGSIGQHVPQDFLNLSAAQNIIELFTKRTIHGDLKLNPVDTSVMESGAQVNIRFAGMDASADIRGQDRRGKADIDFRGITISANRTIALKPFKLNFDATQPQQATLRIDNLNLNIDDPANAHIFSAELHNFSQTVHLLDAVAGQPDSARPTALNLAFNDITLQEKVGHENGSLNIKNGDLHFGFFSDNGDFRLKFIAKGTPTLAGKVAAAANIVPTDVNINLSAGPFSRTQVITSIDDLSNRLLIEKIPSRLAVMQTLSRLFSDNILNANLNLDIDSMINNADGPLLTAKGHIQEFIKQDSEILRLTLNPLANIPNLFHGSTLDIFAARKLLEYNHIGETIEARGFPIRNFLTADGDLMLSISIGEHQVLLNGHPVVL